MRRVTAACLVLVGLIVLTPSVAFAQATITGIVKDTSGAVLPGVTVEVTSPDLIEKVRTATTDGDGQYRIIDLRGGTYTVTFSLPGFSTVRREGIQLAGTFVAGINAELKVGALQETVVVTGESPIVDVQSVTRQTTLTNETINEIPAVRSYAGLMSLMPNMVTPGGAAANSPAPNMVVFGAAGGRVNEGRLQVDGISVGTAFNGAGVSAYVVDVNNVQEIVLTASGGLGEAEVGGPTLNILPKEGGNTALRVVLRRHRDARHGREQLHRRTAGSRPDDARLVREPLGLQLRHRRADPEGPALVFRSAADGRLQEHGPGHVCQCQRGEPERLDVRAGPLTTGLSGGVVQYLRAPPDLAAHGQEQDQRLVGRAEAVRRRGVRRRCRGLPSLRAG